MTTTWTDVRRMKVEAGSKVIEIDGKKWLVRKKRHPIWGHEMDGWDMINKILLTK